MALHQSRFTDSLGFAAEFAASRHDFLTSAPDTLLPPTEFIQNPPDFIGNAADAHIFATSSRMNQAEQEFLTQHSQPLKLDLDQHLVFCSICTLPIHDRILLTCNGENYHDSCFYCWSCQTQLQHQPTCFYKDGHYFCKGCYKGRFGSKCATCDRIIQSTDWVRRARDFVFHLACFACDQCKRQLSTGEEFALQDSRLLCKQHFVELVEGETGTSTQKQKTKRVRTTFSDDQLAVLQGNFQIDSNPDGADLERIATETGLSKRVTQVWFQNSRARQKKYQGNRKGEGGEEEDSQRSSEGPASPGQKSESSEEGQMRFPTSVTTSAEEAMIESTAALSCLQYE